MKKSFAQLQAAIESGDEALISSDKGNSHFQFLHTAIQNETSFAQKSLRDFNLRNVILLDNQSMVSLFCNKRFATNIHEVDKPLCLKSNGGQMRINKIASIRETDV